jgi:hypothetical protein
MGVQQRLARLTGPVVPLFRALTGRLKLTVRRHKFNKDSLSLTMGIRYISRHQISDMTFSQCSKSLNSGLTDDSVGGRAAVQERGVNTATNFPVMCTASPTFFSWSVSEVLDAQ